MGSAGMNMPLSMKSALAAGMLAAMLGAPASAEAGPDQASVADAIAALKAHLAGMTELDGKRIDALTKTIADRRSEIVESDVLVWACIDLVATYDKLKGPLWVEYRGLHNRKRTPGDEIHWAVFWVMQHLIDEVYTPAGLERHARLLDGFSFGCADLFPGKVDPPEDPTAAYTVKIDGSYPKTFGGPVMHMDRPARKPTGAYLVPGAIATVRVPASLVNKGYQVRVGAHSWDMEKRPRVLRLFRCTTLYDIKSAEVRVANPLGGGIYIEVPYLAEGGVVEVSIKNAARSPYFSWKDFHKTTLDEWRDVERHREAPWADFQSEKFMMQVPTSWIYELDDPETLMRDWDMAMDAIGDLMGRPRRFGRETMYSQVDLQLRGRAFFPGYPMCNRGYDPRRDYGGYVGHHLVRGPRYAHSYAFHEQGHAFLFSKYVGDMEAVVNFLHVAVLHRKFGFDLQEAFRASRSQTNKFMTLETTAIAWMMSDSFVKRELMKGYERQYQLKGHAKFVDIVRLFGWKVLDDFWRSVNQDYEDGKPWERNVKDTDAYTLRMSEMAGVDLRPLIHFWGIPTLDHAKSDREVEASGLRRSAKIHDLLLKYKGLVPADNAAFREFALKWWQKQPSPKGYTTQRNHAARWESYDEKEARRVRRYVQDIIDRYFPGGRPDGPDAPARMKN